MAKKSMVARDAKRGRIAAKYASKRAELKRIINDRSAAPEQVDEFLTEHVDPVLARLASDLGRESEVRV